MIGPFDLSPTGRKALGAGAAPAPAAARKIALGLVVVALLAAGAAVLLAGKPIGELEQRQADAKAREVGARTELEQLALGEEKGAAAAQLTLVRETLATRSEWGPLLEDLARSLPASVRLVELGSGEGTPGAAGGVSLRGCSEDPEDAPDLMRTLAAMPSVAAVELASTAEGKEADDAEDCVDPEAVFELTIALALPEGEPVAPAGSSTGIPAAVPEQTGSTGDSATVAVTP